MAGKRKATDLKNLPLLSSPESDITSQLKIQLHQLASYSAEDNLFDLKKMRVELAPQIKTQPEPQSIFAVNFSANPSLSQKTELPPQVKTQIGPQSSIFAMKFSSSPSLTQRTELPPQAKPSLKSNPNPPTFGWNLSSNPSVVQKVEQQAASTTTFNLPQPVFKTQIIEKVVPKPPNGGKFLIYFYYSSS